MLAGLSLGGLHAGGFQGLRQRAADGLYPVGATSSRVVVVGIDGRSLAESGKAWPWPRSLQAELIDRLTSARASVVVEDLVFSPAAAGDASLASSVRRSGRVVLAEAPVLRRADDGLLLEGDSIAGPTPEVANSAAAIGHSAITPEPSDGVVRSEPLVIEDHDGHLIPSLALAALMVGQHTGDVITLRPNSVVVGGTSIPTGELHSLTISYSDGIIDPSRTVSAADVLSGRVGADALAGKIVLVGVTDPTLGDNHLIPPNKQSGVPGVMVDAAALNTMLTGTFVHDASYGDIALCVLVLALLAGAAFLYLRLAVAVPALLVLAGGYLLWVFERFNDGQVHDLVYPLSATVVSVMVAIAVRYLTESRQQRRVAALFSSYVPETVARQLIRDDLVDEVVAGRRTTITAFFCDLRGFTPLAASLSPAEVRQVLDLHYDHVCQRILEQGGTIMQFVGDEVFAVFGAPIELDDHSERAFRTAIAVQDTSAELTRRLAGAGLPPVHYGIGLHSGEVVAAHVGPRGRRQYAVVGDPVNVGSRLCGRAAAGEVILSEAVQVGLTDPAGLIDLGAVELKGVAGGVRSFSRSADEGVC